MLSSGGALRLEPVRIGVRTSERLRDGADTRPAMAHFALDDMKPGVRRVGPLQLTLSRVHHGDAATFDVRIANPGGETTYVEAICLGFRFSGFETQTLRYLKNGWQSWSFDGTRELDEAGEPEFPSGPWLRGFHHPLNAPPGDRLGWHESATVAAVGGGELGATGAACVVGVFERDCSFGAVYLKREIEDGRSSRDGIAIEIELQLEVPLAPGDEMSLDPVRVAIGTDASELLESFATLWGRFAGARTASPFRVGWCSWYHFFHDVTEADVLRNIEALANARSEIPVEIIQLDDGYQRAIGDWLHTNAKFPRGLAPLANEIRAAGFTAGLWTAPFAVVAESEVFQKHPQWLLRDLEEPRLFRGTLHDEWTKERWVYALDTTQPVVLLHLENLFRELREMGFTYQKLDFLHVAAMRAQSSTPGVTRAARLRAGLEAIRRGAGEDAFLLGCGCPLGPAVGVVDAMRIGPDVAPCWHREGGAIPGLEATLPSTRSAVRSVLHRAWMHRRLWLNDPDCLMARRSKTKLSMDEARTLAAVIAATGGMVVISDDVPLLDEQSRELIRDCARVAADVDAAGGSARLVDLLSNTAPGIVRAAHGLDTTLCLSNAEDAPENPRVPLSAVRLGRDVALRPLLGSRGARVSTDEPGFLSAQLAPHESAIVRVNGRPLAVFCDFDGTFSLQDVGSTLAKRHLAPERAQLWKRYEAGTLTPWQYALELLDGFEFPEAELDSFLRTIALDPGSRDLVSWCRDEGIPFKVVSDGFDRNIEKLCRIHRIEFHYYANRLVYEGVRWRISAGYPSATCTCGTGTCKSGIISLFRAANPGAFCVHIGNGRVSDLCGAREADLAFARRGETDTLGPALEERGLPFRWFDTLADVRESLIALRAGRFV